MRRMTLHKLIRLEARMNATPLRDPVAEDLALDLLCDQIRESLLSFGLVQGTGRALRRPAPATWESTDASSIGYCWKVEWLPVQGTPMQFTRFTRSLLLYSLFFLYNFYFFLIKEGISRESREPRWSEALIVICS